jgi:hypothetical protein
VSSTRLRWWVGTRANSPNAEQSKRLLVSAASGAVRRWSDEPSVSSEDACLLREGPSRLEDIRRALEGRRIGPPVCCPQMVNRGVNDPPPVRRV